MMVMLTTYVVPVGIIIVLIMLAKRARSSPMASNYLLVLIVALLATGYAKLAELTGTPIGTDIISAPIAIVIVLCGIGFLIWSFGNMLKMLFKKTEPEVKI